MIRKDKIMDLNSKQDEKNSNSTANIKRLLQRSSPSYALCQPSTSTDSPCSKRFKRSLGWTSNYSNLQPEAVRKNLYNEFTAAQNHASTQTVICFYNDTDEQASSRKNINRSSNAMFNRSSRRKKVTYSKRSLNNRRLGRLNGSFSQDPTSSPRIFSRALPISTRFLPSPPITSSPVSNDRFQPFLPGTHAEFSITKSPQSFNMATHSYSLAHTAAANESPLNLVKQLKKVREKKAVNKYQTDKGFFEQYGQQRVQSMSSSQNRSQDAYQDSTINCNKDIKLEGYEDRSHQATPDNVPLDLVKRFDKDRYTHVSNKYHIERGLLVKQEQLTTSEEDSSLDSYLDRSSVGYDNRNQYIDGDSSLSGFLALHGQQRQLLASNKVRNLDGLQYRNVNDYLGRNIEVLQDRILHNCHDRHPNDYQTRHQDSHPGVPDDGPLDLVKRFDNDRGFMNQHEQQQGKSTTSDQERSANGYQDHKQVMKNLQLINNMMNPFSQNNTQTTNNRIDRNLELNNLHSINNMMNFNPVTNNPHSINSLMNFNPIINNPHSINNMMNLNHVMNNPYSVNNMMNYNHVRNNPHDINNMIDLNLVMNNPQFINNMMNSNPAMNNPQTINNLINPSPAIINSQFIKSMVDLNFTKNKSQNINNSVYSNPHYTNPLVNPSISGQLYHAPMLAWDTWSSSPVLSTALPYILTPMLVNRQLPMNPITDNFLSTSNPLAWVSETPTYLKPMASNNYQYDERQQPNITNGINRDRNLDDDNETGEDDSDE